MSVTPAKNRDFVLYFLRLGALGFGGPIVLAARMRQDLVETRRWINTNDYEQGLALSQLAPGPLAAQLAIYLGWVKGGTRLATAVAFAFIAPSFVMVIAIAAFYVRSEASGWLQGAFYGVGAAVIALMAQGASKLFRKTVGKDRLLAVIAVTTMAATIAT